MRVAECLYSMEMINYRVGGIRIQGYVERITCLPPEWESFCMCIFLSGFINIIEEMLLLIGIAGTGI